jgi:hypothetical protein
MICLQAFDSTMAFKRRIATIESAIYLIRVQRVMLDSDLAAIHRVATKQLNRQLERNRQPFPKDFPFQITAQEAADLRSQFATSKRADGAQASCLWGSRASRLAFRNDSAGWKPVGPTAKMAMPRFRHALSALHNLQS